MTRIICGVDVSSSHLDAGIGRHGALRRFERTPEGIAACAAFCKDHGVELVVMEATGGYERLPFMLLWEAGLPTAIANPRAVRDFAKAMGVLEKTDRLDARIIAWYADVKDLEPQRPAGETQDKLRAKVKRLRQLTELRAGQKRQRHLVTDPEILASVDEVIAFVTRQIRQLEQAIAEMIDTDPLWSRLDRLFRSVKGIAGRTVARLMADLPEIGTISGKAIAKLVGVAPLANDSGQASGKRPIRGGRQHVRDILFLITEMVRRCEPDFQAFSDKLKAAGKPKKVIRIALARKLLVRLNAKARDERLRLHHAA